MKRTPPIYFYAKIYGPIGEGPGVNADAAAASNAELQEVVKSVEGVLHGLRREFADCSFELRVDEHRTSEFWLSVEEDNLVLFKRDLDSAAAAVGALRPEQTVYLWLCDADDNEYGVEVFRDEIKADPDRRSRDHERITSYLGRLIEVYAEHADIELSPYRSWTLKNAGTAGGEPDECYIVGADQSKDRPDLVIEVVWTSGGIDKLAICQRLGIDEVWFWIAGQLEVHALRGSTYARVPRSRWLPGLDLDLMYTFLDRRSVHVAKRDYREALGRAK